MTIKDSLVQDSVILANRSTGFDVVKLLGSPERLLIIRPGVEHGSKRKAKAPVLIRTLGSSKRESGLGLSERPDVIISCIFQMLLL